MRPRGQGAPQADANSLEALLVSERLAVHRLVASVSLAVAVVATTLPAAADLPPAVARMVAAEAKVSSVHVTAGAGDNAVAADIVRSGDFAFTTLGSKNLKLTAVGNDFYFQAADQPHFYHETLAKGREQFADLLGVFRLPDSYAQAPSVTFAETGSDTLDAKPIHKVKATKDGASLVMWIGPDDLIYRIDFLKPDGTLEVTTNYSQFGALTSIAPPTGAVDIPPDAK